MGIIFESWAGILGFAGLVVVLGVIFIKLWLIMRLPAQQQGDEES